MDFIITINRRLALHHPRCANRFDLWSQGLHVVVGDIKLHAAKQLMQRTEELDHGRRTGKRLNLRSNTMTLHPDEHDYTGTYTFKAS